MIRMALASVARRPGVVKGDGPLAADGQRSGDGSYLVYPTTLSCPAHAAFGKMTVPVCQGDR